MCTTNKDLKYFSSKLIFVALPFILLIIAYVITDPTKKLYNYDQYSFDYVMLHRGDISTRVFLKNKDKYHYDSFIFGSSRSCAHTAKEWKQYLSPDNSPFSFGSWNEPIEGIYKKMQLIDQSHLTMKNAFIILDVDYAFVPPPQNSLEGDHYLISGQSKWKYYLNDIRNYVTNPRLVLTSIDYTIFKEKRFYFRNFVGLPPDYVDPITNDWGSADTEPPVIKDSYKRGADSFYSRAATQQYENKKIDQNKAMLLKKMADLLNRQHCKFFIVISPIYKQYKFHPDDMMLLQQIFGKENVYDYSGINSITNDIYNYYTDVKHYRKSVANTIFNEIYGSAK